MRLHKIFYALQSQEAIDKRNEKLTHYLTEELQVLNEEMIRKGSVAKF